MDESTLTKQVGGFSGFDRACDDVTFDGNDNVATALSRFACVLESREAAR